jgi:hypothetical protein
MLRLIRSACYQLTDIQDINLSIYTIYQTIIIRMNIQPNILHTIRRILINYSLATKYRILSIHYSDMNPKYLRCSYKDCCSPDDILIIHTQPHDNDFNYNDRYLNLCSACMFS